MSSTVWIIIGFILLCSLALLFYMYKEAHRNHINYQHLTFHDFPKSFGSVKIFFISDIHKRIISNDFIRHLKGKADLVIIGGDLAEKGVSLTKVMDNVKKLKEIGPLYFVWGNNDYEVDYHELDAILLDLGVKILDNTALTFESETGEKLNLLGVDDVSSKRDRLDLALSDCPKEGFRILVSHCPKIMKKVKDEHNIRFILSGHTHGGQIRIGKWGLYQKGGIYQENKVTILISNGYGTTSVPFRLGAPAETHFITLSSETD